MKMKKPAILLLALALLTPSTTVLAADKNAMTARIEAFRAEADVKDVAVAVLNKDGVLYLESFGGYGPDTRIPVASASKWLTVTTFMVLVDQGKVSLDAPVSTWLPDLPQPYAGLTPRQLLSYTAGLHSLARMVDLRQPQEWTLAQSAADVAARPLEDPPGTVFSYGGANMQIIGAVVEKVTGKSWAAFFEEAVARPLGLRNSFWGHPTKSKDGPPGPTNPVLQAGLFTTVSDYSAFLDMLLQGGQYKGRRILSPAAIKAVESIETKGKEMKWVPPGAAPGAAYMIGHWCERVAADGACQLETSPGAFGAYPFLDHAAGIAGIIFVQDKLHKIAPELRALRDDLIHLSATGG